jgi:hypothetical protein
MGILTVAVVTRPFAFEGKKRLEVAQEGLAELAQHVDSLITIPNEKLLEVLGKNTSLLDAFKRGQRRVAGRGAGHRRPDHPPGHDQRRLRRRAHRDVRNGHGDDGHRSGGRRRAGA